MSSSHLGGGGGSSAQKKHKINTRVWVSYLSTRFNRDGLNRFRLRLGFWIHILNCKQDSVDRRSQIFINYEFHENQAVKLMG